jgi:hypothetical protein
MRKKTRKKIIWISIEKAEIEALNKWSSRASDLRKAKQVHVDK